MDAAHPLSKHEALAGGDDMTEAESCMEPACGPDETPPGGNCHRAKPAETLTAAVTYADLLKSPVPITGSTVRLMAMTKNDIETVLAEGSSLDVKLKGTLIANPSGIFPGTTGNDLPQAMANLRTWAPCPVSAESRISWQLCRVRLCVRVA